MPNRLWGLLHCSFYIKPYPWDAAGQTGEHALRTARQPVALQNIRLPAATESLCRVAAGIDDVRQ